MIHSIETMSNAILKECAGFMMGNIIGSGMSRGVYDYRYDPTKVIKFEYGTENFQNVMEWRIWQEYKNCEEVARWLAPCHSISLNGNFLIMEKAADLQPDQIPNVLPEFLTDHKPENFGIIGAGKKKRVVCRDYGFVVLSLETKKRNWGAY